MVVEVTELCVDNCLLDAVEYPHCGILELNMPVLADICVDEVANEYFQFWFCRQAFYLYVPVSMVFGGSKPRRSGRRCMHWQTICAANDEDSQVKCGVNTSGSGPPLAIYLSV